MRYRLMVQHDILGCLATSLRECKNKCIFYTQQRHSEEIHSPKKETPRLFICKFWNDQRAHRNGNYLMMGMNSLWSFQNLQMKKRWVSFFDECTLRWIQTRTLQHFFVRNIRFVRGLCSESDIHQGFCDTFTKISVTRIRLRAGNAMS